MSDKSKIEWTDATWNPVTGCTKVSQGCKHCYAERDWKRLRANRASVYYGRDFTNVQCHPERLDQPLRWRRGRRIFVNSMSDLFHEAVPDTFIAEVFAYMAYGRQHVFQVLTKRPERMRDLMHDLQFNDLVVDAMLVASTDAEEILGQRGEFSPNERRTDDVRAYDPDWPLPNVWLGVSVEDQETADERIPRLVDTPAAVRFLSCEPMLGPIDLEQACEITNDGFHKPVWPLDWVIAGGESGPHARPSHPDWFRSLRDQCAAADVPFLFKQWGEWVSVSEVEGQGYIHTFPDGACVRRIGKKRAGRTLDHSEHNELPTPGGLRA